MFIKILFSKFLFIMSLLMSIFILALNWGAWYKPLENGGIVFDTFTFVIVFLISFFPVWLLGIVRWVFNKKKSIET